MFEIEDHLVAVNDPQKDESKSAPQDFEKDAPCFSPICALFIEGEGKGYPREKEEEGKDRVVMQQAVPFDMRHVFGDRFRGRAGPCVSKRGRPLEGAISDNAKIFERHVANTRNQRRETDDAEHVDSA